MVVPMQFTEQSEGEPLVGCKTWELRDPEKSIGLVNVKCVNSFPPRLNVFSILASHSQP